MIIDNLRLSVVRWILISATFWGITVAVNSLFCVPGLWYFPLAGSPA